MISRRHSRFVPLAAFAAAGLGFCIATLATRYLAPLDGSQGTVGKKREGDAAALPVRPSATWSPEDVVRHQLTALNESGDGEEGIRRCYQFASPLNRAATGPFARFERMVRSPPYDVMLRSTDMLIGDAVVRDDRAAVLVTFIDPTRSVNVFRFILSKQTGAPYAGCWMTDAVDNIPSNVPWRGDG